MVRLRAPKPVILLRPLGVDTAPSTSRGARAGGARQGWRLGQGGKGTTGAKEQTVVAAVARTDTVSAGPRSAQAGEYRIRLPPLCGSQRMPAGLSGHRQAANPGCRFVRRRTPAKASVRRWECPRSESKSPQKCLKLQQIQSGRRRSTPNHTPTTLGVLCASRSTA